MFEDSCHNQPNLRGIHDERPTTSGGFRAEEVAQLAHRKLAHGLVDEVHVQADSKFSQERQLDDGRSTDEDWHLIERERQHQRVDNSAVIAHDYVSSRITLAFDDQIRVSQTEQYHLCRKLCDAKMSIVKLHKPCRVLLINA